LKLAFTEVLSRPSVLSMSSSDLTFELLEELGPRSSPEVKRRALGSVLPA